MNDRKNLRIRLAEQNLTFVWLINMLKARGMKLDKSEMSSAVNGTISGNKADAIIKNSHFVMDEYEKFVRSISA